MILTSNYKFSEAREIDNTFIIRLQGNDESKRLADRCAYSCYLKGQRYTFWDAFDGTKDNVVRVPVARRADWINWIKIPNNKYSPSQVACFFSHVSLWAHCAEIDKPIVILEHDAVCEKPLIFHKYYNCIQYLGSREQHNGALVSSVPPHASIYGGQWRSICRAHAYAIDSPIARNLLSYVIREGMTKTLDMFMRADIFPIVQDDLYFYDKPGTSTINELEDYSEDC